MCSGCFCLFEQATDYILEAHRTELDKMAANQHAIIKLLLEFKKKTVENQGNIAPEAKELLRKLAQITGVTGLVEEEDHNRPKDVRFPLPRPISPSPQVLDKLGTGNIQANHQVFEERAILKPINNLGREPEQNRGHSSNQVIHGADDSTKFRAIISSPSKQPVASKSVTPIANKKGLSEAVKPAVTSLARPQTSKQLAQSDSHQSPFSSTLKSTQSAPGHQMAGDIGHVSEIDRKIRELENEQLFLGVNTHQMLRANSPVMLHTNPNKKLASTTQEGRSLETDITLSHTMEDSRRGKKSLDRSDISKPLLAETTKPSTKKKNMMSLVYKVNTKTLDLDKFDRKKSKPGSKLAQEETIHPQTNGKSVEHRREQSSASSFFNDDLSICYKESADSAHRSKPISIDPASIRPLKDLEKLRKSSDLGPKPLDTPHF